MESDAVHVEHMIWVGGTGKRYDRVLSPIYQSILGDTFAIDLPSFSIQEGLMWNDFLFVGPVVVTGYLDDDTGETYLSGEVRTLRYSHLVKESKLNR